MLIKTLNSAYSYFYLNYSYFIFLLTDFCRPNFKAWTDENTIPLIYVISFLGHKTKKQTLSCFIVLLSFSKLNVPLSICFVKAYMWSWGALVYRRKNCLCFSVKLLCLDKWCSYGIVEYRAIPVNVRIISCNGTWDPLFCL